MLSVADALCLASISKDEYCDDKEELRFEAWKTEVLHELVRWSSLQYDNVTD